MSNFFSRIWSIGIVGTLLAGLLVILPIALTLGIINWMGGKIAGVLGPGSTLGDLIASGGSTIVGPNQTTLAYIAGLIIAMAIVWTIGVVVKTLARQQLNQGVDRLFERLPIIRTIYKPVAQVVRLFGAGNDQDLKTMSVVACRFDGLDFLGLAASSKTYQVAGEERRLVYLPTAPIPMTGGLIMIPTARVVPMPDISVDELIKLQLSLGVITPASISTDTQSK